MISFILENANGWTATSAFHMQFVTLCGATATKNHLENSKLHRVELSHFLIICINKFTFATQMEDENKTVWSKEHKPVTIFHTNYHDLITRMKDIRDDIARTQNSEIKNKVKQLDFTEIDPQGS